MNKDDGIIEAPASFTSNHSLIAPTDSTSEATADSTCPVCACVLLDQDEQHICETCATPHHQDCWEYAEGCAIFGCRKGIIRNPSDSEGIQTSTSSVNLRLMTMWSWFFRLHWLTFVFTVYGCMIATFMGSIVMIGEMLIGTLAIYPYFPKFPILMGMVIAWLSIALGTLAYIFLLPVGVIMLIHLRAINITLPPGNSALAKSIADRVDISAPFRFLQDINSLLPKIINTLIIASIVSFIIMQLAAVTPYVLFTDTIGALVLVKLLLLPLFKRAVKSRSTLLATFQNRLMASAKRAKDQQQ